jgi:hypothetical protein
MRCAKRIEYRRRRLVAMVPPAWHDNDVGASQQLQVAIGPDSDAARRAQLPRLSLGNLILIKRAGEFGPR